ncbi:hypothetical protein D5086_020329 [Populus alba]|uniref:Uncharacterized protein n=1 Tax=Populus alba TaxID=43335 RepID=A0ACC4BJP8_POPAL
MPLIVERIGSTTLEQMHSGPSELSAVSPTSNLQNAREGFNHRNKAHWANRVFGAGWNRNRVASTTIIRFNHVATRNLHTDAKLPGPTAPKKYHWRKKREEKSDSQSELSLFLARLTDSVTEPVTPRISVYFSLSIHHVFDRITGLKNNHWSKLISLSFLSPSMVLPLPLRRRRVLNSSSFSANNRRLPPPRISSFSSASHPLDFSRRSSRSRRRVSCRLESGSGDGDRDAKEEDNSNDDGSEEVERALHLDGTIPGTSNEFVKQVSSRAYDMRRHLQQSFDSSSYDVLDANPWRETSKPVYVLTQRENQLCTMKTRRNISEVEKELGLLFSKGGKWRSEIGSQTKQSRRGTKFQMLVEDVREGVLVFEDENEAVRYCDLLQGGGKGCEGVAEIEASSVFDLCQKMRALAVLFRRGRTPPLPQSLELNLRARKRSLEDQEDLV